MTVAVKSSTKETLKKSASGMECKAYETQRLKPIKEIGEGASTALCCNPPARAFIQRLPNQCRQGGFVLIASLVIMVVLTLIAVAIFRGVGLQEKIASNLREKQRAFDIAQNTLTFGQNWLSTNTFAQIDCANAAATIGANNTPIVCSNSSAYPANNNALMQDLQSENAGTPYTPGGMAALHISRNGGENAVYALPRLFIQYIGDRRTNNGNNPLYRITAIAWGGNKNAVAIVQSVYALPGSARDLGSIY